VEEISAPKKEEGDAVLVEEGWKEESCLSAFIEINSFMGRGKMGGRRKWGRVIRREIFSQKRSGDHPLTIVGRRREIRGEIRREMLAEFVL